MVQRPKARFDAKRIVDDAAARGWMATDLAREAGVSQMTMTRFLRSETQTAKTAKKIARALGRSPATYLIRETSAA